MNRYITTKILPWNSRNKWYFEITDITTKKIKRISDKDLEKLVLQKRDIDKEIAEGIYGQEFVSLEEVFTRYMGDIERRKPTAATINDYNHCANQLWKIKIKNQYIRNIGIKDFTVADINLINVEMNNKFSPRYNGQCFNLLTRIFKFALNHNLGVLMNPCREVDRSEFKQIKKRHKENKDDPIIVQGGFAESLKKIKGLLDKLKNWTGTNRINKDGTNHCRPLIGVCNIQAYIMVRLMSELGGRLAEVLPLQKTDYNPGTRSIDINKSYNTSTGELRHRTKTTTGMRTVALSDPMADLLEDYMCIKKVADGELLFPSRNYTIINGSNFASRVLNRFNKELGIKGRINPHSFRVFVITLREYLEHKKKHMMEDSGHATKQISDHYVRGKWVNFDRKRKDANEIAGLLN